jgi:integrase
MLLRSLRGYSGRRSIGYALQLLALVFVRPGELRLAEWAEFDLEARVWRIPARRAKMRKQHLVPLSRQVIAILKELRSLAPDSPRLFPSSRNPHSAISAQSFRTALDELGYESSEQTPHGFRTTASTLLRELGWNPDVVERQLAHADPNKLRRVYNHAEYLDARTRMMQAWANYLDLLRSGRSERPLSPSPLTGLRRHPSLNEMPPVTRLAPSPMSTLAGDPAMVLTERQARLALPRSTPYKLADGRGLYLHVGVSGGKHWHYRYRFAGHDTAMSLGAYPYVSLDRARVNRLAAQQVLKSGLDPQAQRRYYRQPTPTFQQIGRLWLAQLLRRVRTGRRSIKTFRKSKALLTQWAFPVFGNRPMDSIEPRDVSALVIGVQARDLHETAHRVLSLCGRIFRYAVGRGLAHRDATRDLRGSLEPVPVVHHAAITDPRRVARLLRDIGRYEGEETTRIALQLAPLLFVRPGELRKARWEEIDVQSAQWRIPAQRMKGRILHIVPLSAQALVWIARLSRLTGHTQLLFPAKIDSKRCMSDNTLNKALRAMGYHHGQMTAHGFRTLASTLLSEHGWPEEVVERQLAHVDRNKVRAAYNHAQHLPLRAVMMQTWADYLDDLRSDRFTTRVLVFHHRASEMTPEGFSI